MQRETIIIIGGGLAGAKAVEGAREPASTGTSFCSPTNLTSPTNGRRSRRTTCEASPGRGSSRVHGDAFYVDHEIEVRTDDQPSRASTDPARS